jgi:predicted glycosyltransferase
MINMARKDPRLDLLIYAHDGRGLGHASRGIAIGAAVRRLSSELKVLFMSGCKQTAPLIGPVPLDWIKLPSYEKVVVNGTPKGRVGHTNLKNSYLVESRTRLIKSIIEEYRPRHVLVDHEAQGKRSELIPSIELIKDTKWILGLRGIIGQVADVWSELAATIFKKYYSALFWYGDESILGREALTAIESHFGLKPVITGYVSRLKEMRHWVDTSFVSRDKKYAGTVAISWGSEASMPVLNSLYYALSKIGDRYGEWQLFMNRGQKIFHDLPFCTIQDLSPRYLYTLSNSKTAMIYGGYNSITDILSVNIPAVILLRGVDDREQEEHVKKLATLTTTSMIVMREDEVEPDRLNRALTEQLHASKPENSGINIDGAETAAKKLIEYISEQG